MYILHTHIGSLITHTLLARSLTNTNNTSMRAVLVEGTPFFNSSLTRLYCFSAHAMCNAVWPDWIASFGEWVCSHYVLMMVNTTWHCQHYKGLCSAVAAHSRYARVVVGGVCALGRARWRTFLTSTSLPSMMACAIGVVIVAQSRGRRGRAVEVVEARRGSPAQCNEASGRLVRGGAENGGSGE
jgi:hypothetical protein